MKKLFLAILLLGMVFAQTAKGDKDFEVSTNSFSINISDVGSYDFLLNGSLHRIRVVGGPTASVRVAEVEDLKTPSILDGYRYYKAHSEGYTPHIEISFAIPRSWIEIKESSYDEVKVFMNDSGKWKVVDLVRQNESDAKKIITKFDVEELGDFAIGIVKGARICEEPAEWDKCIRGKKTRVVYQIVEGICVPKTETMDCPIELKASYNSLASIIALFGLFIMVPLVAYPIIKARKPY